MARPKTVSSDADVPAVHVAQDALVRVGQTGRSPMELFAADAMPRRAGGGTRPYVDRARDGAADLSAHTESQPACATTMDIHSPH